MRRLRGRRDSELIYKNHDEAVTASSTTETPLVDSLFESRAGVVAKPGMATGSRGNAPGDELQTGIPSGRLIIDRVDEPLED